MNSNELALKWRKTFSHVYCVSYAPYKDRRESLFKELARVGIVHGDYDVGSPTPFFSIHYTVPNPIEALLLSHPDFKWPKYNKRFNRGALNLAMGHYSVMKEAMSLGHLRILVIEDDIAFLKSLDKIAEILDGIPLEADLIMYDKVTNWKEGWDYVLENSKTVNGLYVKLSAKNVLWTTSCYSVTSKAMNHICESQEKCFNVADFYTNDFVASDQYGARMLLMHQGIKRYSSVTNLACQKPSEETISDHGSTNSVYNQIGLFDCYINLEDYNI